MRLTTLILLPPTIAALSACALFERSLRSGYANQTAFAPAFDPNLNPRLVSEAREELGYGERTLNRDEARALGTRVRLKESESHLNNRRERAQYFRQRGNLRDDRERLYVLSLPGPSARAAYGAARKSSAPEDLRPDEIAAAIEAKDIALGMSQRAVGESWGDPDQVETSGDPAFAIERWRYNRYVSGGDGYRKEMRTVYFEGGRVTGWERN